MLVSYIENYYFIWVDFLLDRKYCLNQYKWPLVKEKYFLWTRKFRFWGEGKNC